MSVKIGSARIDERGKTSGGKAGDQTGNEVGTQSWYKHSKGWRVFRAKNAEAREKIADAMSHACSNSHIGYDQGQRNDLYAQVKNKGFDPAKATTNTETDCSALVRVCCAYAGITLPNFNTSSEATALLNSGAFTEKTGTKYTAKDTYLRRGDILVTKTKGHTVVVISNGAGNDGDVGATQPSKPVIESIGNVEVTGTSVNIRRAPSTAYESISIAHKSDRFETVNTEGWVPILFNDSCRWVIAKYVVYKDDKAEINANSVNIRKGPSTDYASVSIAKGGESFYIFNTNGWIPINYKDEVCWVSSKYMKEV